LASTTYKWITITTGPMRRSHNQNSKREHPEYTIANIATFVPYSDYFIWVFLKPLVVIFFLYLTL